jgi:hypothetical protein
MPVAIVIAPDLDKVLVTMTAIARVDADLAKVRSGPMNPWRIDDLPIEHTMLKHELVAGARKWLAHQQSQGYEYVDVEDIHFYGPTPGRNYGETMVDVKRVEPREAVKMVHDVPKRIGGSAHYRLVAKFLKTPVLTEVIIPDGD